MAEKTYKDIMEYVERECECKALSAKPEQHFSDLEVEVTVWNVKTDKDKNWWVVEGEGIPMNLYPQDAYYFGSDEVYSFHMGIVSRLIAKKEEFVPEHFVNAVSLGGQFAPQLYRKLKNVSVDLDNATEVEDFQKIGVQCREILIDLGNHIYLPVMADSNEQLHESDFKRKSEEFIRFFLNGSENSDYRNIIKRMTEGTWEYTNKMTHSKNSTFYEASTCITLCISLVTLYENLFQKHFDVLSKCQCSVCKSKKLSILEEEFDDRGELLKLNLLCEECAAITEVFIS